MVRRSLALAVALLLIAQPANVNATAYSAMTYSFRWTPAGYSQTNLCEQAGEIDTNQNYGQVQGWVNNNFNCIGTAQYLPSGWYGIKVDGYRDGAYCGSSGYYYSTTYAFGWQIWITLCSNPSGAQSFTTTATGIGYDGTGGYWSGRTVTSPAQNY